MKEIFVNIFYTVTLIGFGILMLKYRKTVHDWTGNWLWAEKILGNGGTHLIIILLGLFFIFYGATYSFGGIPFLFGK